MQDDGLRGSSREEIALDPVGIALDPQFVASVESWLTSGDAGGRVLVLSQSQTGSGVSSMLHRLQSRHDASFVYVSCGTHSSKRTVLMQRKIMLLDPPDEEFLDPARTAALARLIETPDIPIVIAGFKRRSIVAKLNAMLKKCTGHVVRMEVPPLEDAVALAVLFRDADDRGIPRDRIERAWHRTHDLRHCLETISSRSADVREILPDGTEGLRAILQPTTSTSWTFTDRCRIAEGDQTIMVDGSFENYWNGLDSIEDASDVMEALCVADRLQACSFSNPTFDPSSLTASLVAGLSTHHVNVKGQIRTFGTVWARQNHQVVKRRQLAKLRGMDVDTAAYIRSMVTSSPERLRETADDLGGDEVWTVLKLWPATSKSISRKRFKTLQQSVDQQNKKSS